LVGSCGTCHAVTIVVLAGISGLAGAGFTHEAATTAIPVATQIG
jgi:hypothetical protein